MAFKDALRTAALAYTPFLPLIGSQWYDTQLPQTAVVLSPSTLGAVVVQQITGPRMYSLTGRLGTYWGRFQFTIWGGQFSAGAELRDSIEAALASFLDTTSLHGIVGLAQNPNFIVSAHDTLFPQTEGPIFQKIVDAMMFVNTNITG